MKYEDLKSHLVEKAIIEKFRKDTSDAKKLRDYFKSMVYELTNPLMEIDSEFFEYGIVGSHADNYRIFNEWIIIVHEQDEVVTFKKANVHPHEILLEVNFVDGRAMVRNRELAEFDLEQFLIVATR